MSYRVKWRQPRDLQGETLIRVLPLAFVALLGVWAAVAYSAREQQRQNLVDTVEFRLRAEARTLANSLQNISLSVRNAAKNSIVVGALVGQDIKRVVKPFLTTFAIGSTANHKAAIVDFLGRPIVNTEYDDAWVARSKNTDWLDRALNGKEDISIAVDHLHIVSPIYLGSTPDGAMIVEIPIKELLDFDEFYRVNQKNNTAELLYRYDYELRELAGGTEKLFTEHTSSTVNGQISTPLREMPGISLIVSHSSELPSPFADRVQQFLAAVFLTLLALVGFSIFVSARLVGRPIRQLIGEIERHGLDIAPPNESAPVEIQQLSARFAAAGQDVHAALNQEKALTAQQRQFVSMVSHEFRTPLTIIDGHAQRLLRRRKRMSDAQVEDSLKVQRGAIRRLVRLMESTLTASKLEAGTIALNRSNFDLRSLIENIVDERKIIDRNTSFLTSLDRIPDLIFADERLMYSVFENIVSNAVKYGSDQPHVKIFGWAEENCVAISIRDNGIGIPEGEIDKIGQRYFRASTSVGIPGTGIGLNMAHTIVTMHFGSLTLESKVGAGSTFTVRLPVSEKVSSEREEQYTDAFHDQKEPIQREGLLRLIYTSLSVIPIDDTELEKIFALCRAENAQRKVTGCLLYSDGIFVQALEGESSVVESLFDKISNDPKHKDVEVLSRESIVRRAFEGWMMGPESLHKATERVDGLAKQFAVPRGNCGRK